MHAGDLSRRGQVSEVESSADWLRSLPHRHKVVIAGNHDLCLQANPRKLLHGLTYLEDEAVEIEGLRIYGSPWTPAHGEWAFQKERGPALRAVWEKVPDQLDLLVTHGPPFGILDQHVEGHHLGCPDLLERVRQVNPALHLFGHVHEAYGCLHAGKTMYVNGCNCALGYRSFQDPVVFDWGGNWVLLRVMPPGRRGAAMASIPFWETLVRLYGAPRPAPHRASEGAFWLEIVGDGYGGGQAQFRAARSHDEPEDGWDDAQHQRWALTFGVPFEEEWSLQLASNPWEKYSEIPHLP